MKRLAPLLFVLLISLSLSTCIRSGEGEASQAATIAAAYSTKAAAVQAIAKVTQMVLSQPIDTPMPSPGYGATNPGSLPTSGHPVAPAFSPTSTYVFTSTAVLTSTAQLTLTATPVAVLTATVQRTVKPSPASTSPPPTTTPTHTLTPVAPKPVNVSVAGTVDPVCAFFLELNPPGYLTPEACYLEQHYWEADKRTHKAFRVFYPPACEGEQCRGVSVSVRTDAAADINWPGIPQLDVMAIGKVSRAYRLDTQYGSEIDLLYLRSKDDLLVQLGTDGGASVLKELEELASLIDEKMPSGISLAPISPSESVSQETHNEYFRELALGKWVDPTGWIPGTTFSRGECPSIDVKIRKEVPLLSILLRDAKTHAMISKTTILRQERSAGLPCLLWSSDPAGMYEYVLAVGNLLVAILPFVVE